MVTELKGEFNYFKWTLDTFENIPVKSWLKSHGVYPSEENYNLATIRSAIEGKTKSKVYFSCKRNNSNAILSGVTFCFDPESLKFTDCLKPDDRRCGSTVKFISSKK